MIILDFERGEILGNIMQNQSESIYNISAKTS